MRQLFTDSGVASLWARGHVPPPPWRLSDFFPLGYVVWFGMVLCKTLNLEYICSAVFAFE